MYKSQYINRGGRLRFLLVGCYIQVFYDDVNKASKTT